MPFNSVLSPSSLELNAVIVVMLVYAVLTGVFLSVLM
jgi:hypothetical protein